MTEVNYWFTDRPVYSFPGREFQGPGLKLLEKMLTIYFRKNSN